MKPRRGELLAKNPDFQLAGRGYSSTASIVLIMLTVPSRMIMVAQHLQDMHGGSDPQMDHDLFLTPGADMPVEQRPPFYIVGFERDRSRFSAWLLLC